MPQGGQTNGRYPRGMQDATGELEQCSFSPGTNSYQSAQANAVRPLGVKSRNSYATNGLYIDTYVTKR